MKGYNTRENDITLLEALLQGERVQYKRESDITLLEELLQGERIQYKRE
jgi:hypothetical protein